MVKMLCAKPFSSSFHWIPQMWINGLRKEVKLKSLKMCFQVFFFFSFWCDANELISQIWPRIECCWGRHFYESRSSNVIEYFSTFRRIINRNHILFRFRWHWPVRLWVWMLIKEHGFSHYVGTDWVAESVRIKFVIKTCHSIAIIIISRLMNLGENHCHFRLTLEKKIFIYVKSGRLCLSYSWNCEAIRNRGYRLLIWIVDFYFIFSENRGIPVPIDSLLFQLYWRSELVRRGRAPVICRVIVYCRCKRWIHPSPRNKWEMKKNCEKRRKQDKQFCGKSYDESDFSSRFADSQSRR